MTVDRRQLPAAPGQIPDFTTVPCGTTRHDGWTEDRQRRFIEALSLTGSVKAVAHRVNMTPEGAYLLRRHPDAGSFRKAWEADSFAEMAMPSQKLWMRVMGINRLRKRDVWGRQRRTVGRAAGLIRA
jgi:hypothetical protein